MTHVHLSLEDLVVSNDAPSKLLRVSHGLVLINGRSCPVNDKIDVFRTVI